MNLEWGGVVCDMLTHQLPASSPTHRKEIPPLTEGLNVDGN